MILIWIYFQKKPRIYVKKQFECVKSNLKQNKKEMSVLNDE